MRWRVFLSLVLMVCILPTTQAGIFGTKKPVKTPSERVTELISILKTDGDENKRYDAAENLRHFDSNQFPQIIPALVEALHNDPKASVRSEVAQSLGKIRPINQLAGQALEIARDKDTSMRVRIQASSSLMSYRWDGYKETKPVVTADKKEIPVIDTHKEPNPVTAKAAVVPAAVKTTAPGSSATTSAAPAQSRSWWNYLPFTSKEKAVPPAEVHKTVAPGVKVIPNQSTEPPLASPVVGSTEKIKFVPPDLGPALAPPKVEAVAVPPLSSTKSDKGSPSDAGPDLPPPN